MYCTPQGLEKIQNAIRVSYFANAYNVIASAHLMLLQSCTLLTLPCMLNTEACPAPVIAAGCKVIMGLAGLRELTCRPAL